MDDHRKHQVSLRGASAKEITRDALLEKVSQERELRNYVRRATAAAIFIQVGFGGLPFATMGHWLSLSFCRLIYPFSSCAACSIEFIFISYQFYQCFMLMEIMWQYSE